MRSARTALSEGAKSLKGIHSARSLAQVMKQVEGAAGRKLPVVREAGDEQEEKHDGAYPFAPIKEPVVAVLDEEEGARMKKKLLPSNLPYIRRNPAL